MIAIGRTLGPLVLACVLGVGILGSAAGCASDVVGDGQFQFTSPGGSSEFDYPAGTRSSLPTMKGPAVGDPATTIDIGSYTGTVVVLNVWGAWCPSCRVETTDLIAAARDLAPSGVQFIGIDVRDGSGDGAAYQQQSGMTYPSIEDPTMRTLLSVRGFPVNAIPSTIVLDRQHKVAHIWLGTVGGADLVKTVTAIAAEDAPR
jgi:thiol-disulfide isomerase/thioredoxin